MSYWNQTPEEKRRTAAAANLDYLTHQFSRLAEAVVAKRYELGLPVFNETVEEVFELLTEADAHLFADDTRVAEHAAPVVRYTPVETAAERADRTRRALFLRPEPTNPATRALLDQIGETNVRAALTATDLGDQC